MNLTARHPRSGELLSTVRFLVRTLAAAGELQRKLTYDGLLAAEVKGTAYLEGSSIAALARDISRGAIRTAVADFLRTTELEAAERAALD